MTEQTKTPKYEFRGQGFSNKREYNNAIAISFLSDDGKNKLIDLMDKAANRVIEKLDVEYEKAAKMLHIGYRNTLQKTLNQDLQLTADSLTVKGYVELNIFTYGPGGSVISNGSEILIRKDFNEEGLEIIGDKILEDLKNVAFHEYQNMACMQPPVISGEEQEYKTNETNVNLFISDDIDAED